MVRPDQPDIDRAHGKAERFGDTNLKSSAPGLSPPGKHRDAVGLKDVTHSAAHVLGSFRVVLETWPSRTDRLVPGGFEGGRGLDKCWIIVLLQARHRARKIDLHAGKLHAAPPEGTGEIAGLPHAWLPGRSLRSVLGLQGSAAYRGP